MALLPCAFCFSLLGHPRDRMLSPMQNCCCRSTSPPGCATALFTNNCTFYSHVSRYDPKIRHSEIQEYIKYLNTTSAHCLWRTRHPTTPVDTQMRVFLPPKPQPTVSDFRRGSETSLQSLHQKRRPAQRRRRSPSPLHKGSLS